MERVSILTILSLLISKHAVDCHSFRYFCKSLKINCNNFHCLYMEIMIKY